MLYLMANFHKFWIEKYDVALYKTFFDEKMALISQNLRIFFQNCQIFIISSSR
jgi:hypothetical protein